MTRTILAALTAIACASPAMAQVNGYYDSQRSIYGGPTTYQWRETPPAYQAPPIFQQRRQMTCTTFGNITTCD